MTAPAQTFGRHVFTLCPGMQKLTESVLCARRSHPPNWPSLLQLGRTRPQLGPVRPNVLEPDRPMAEFAQEARVGTIGPKPSEGIRRMLGRNRPHMDENRCHKRHWRSQCLRFRAGRNRPSRLRTMSCGSAASSGAAGIESRPNPSSLTGGLSMFLARFLAGAGPKSWSPSERLGNSLENEV